MLVYQRVVPVYLGTSWIRDQKNPASPGSRLRNAKHFPPGAESFQHLVVVCLF